MVKKSKRLYLKPKTASGGIYNVMLGAKVGPIRKVCDKNDLSIVINCINGKGPIDLIALKLVTSKFDIDLNGPVFTEFTHELERDGRLLKSSLISPQRKSKKPLMLNWQGATNISQQEQLNKRFKEIRSLIPQFGVELAAYMYMSLVISLNPGMTEMKATGEVLKSAVVEKLERSLDKRTKEGGGGGNRKNCSTCKFKQQFNAKKIKNSI